MISRRDSSQEIVRSCGEVAVVFSGLDAAAYGLDEHGIVSIASEVFDSPWLSTDWWNLCGFLISHSSGHPLTTV
jgi:hypothetical protein